MTSEVLKKELFTTRRFITIHEALNALIKVVSDAGCAQGFAVGFDLDETLRQSFEDGLSGHPGRIRPEVYYLLKQLTRREVPIAVVTNQPSTGHQVSHVVAGLRGYTLALPALRFLGIEVFGYESRPWSFLTFPASIATSVLGLGGLYKESPEAVSNFVSWAETSCQGDLKHLIYVGNNNRDKDFTRLVALELAESGAGCAVEFYQLPNFSSFRSGDGRSRSGGFLRGSRGGQAAQEIER
ncbi:hypothetical protein H6802_01150 [Candidatus Nomurabacteria bacterium]|uniref:Uncharacterized protein n=1 Tax=candidate division WWE3 bacterium TaxID=2053526 RepID=A0A955E047_UNCKA|nr:hypothetical protein [candidate division WWE3 bacterium]MCB9823549.1 hypothetical protein [Candidatus Nomurabacteria bacterium]MCB9827344.1 hypothetical protein [Candidatus Nomurabacteria bacterium]HXK52500.1 hypothetical protein [bacterium]